jgi:hypothetical protein
MHHQLGRKNRGFPPPAPKPARHGIIKDVEAQPSQAQAIVLVLA